MTKPSLSKAFVLFTLAALTACGGGSDAPGDAPVGTLVRSLCGRH